MEKLVEQNEYNLDVISVQVDQVQNTINKQADQWATVRCSN